MPMAGDNNMGDKCSPEDPQRCQGVTPDGQCQYLAGEGSKYCNFHARGKGEKKLHRGEVERYLIDNQELRQSYERQHDDLDYLNLKKEILLTQALLERRVKAINNDADIISAVSQSMQLIQRLESMKISLMKIQQQLGLVLGKEDLRALAGEIALILDTELDGIEDKDERLDRILERLFKAIEKAGKKDKE